MKSLTSVCHQFHANGVVAVLSIRVEVLKLGGPLNKRLLPLSFKVKRISENYSCFGVRAAGNDFFNLSVCLVVHPPNKIFIDLTFALSHYVLCKIHKDVAAEFKIGFPLSMLLAPLEVKHGLVL